MDTIDTKIQTLTKDIGLPAIRKNYHNLIAEFGGKESEYSLFLYKLLELEYSSRIQNRKASRIRQAGFPFKKYLEDINTKELPPDAQKRLSELEKLKFISDGRNIFWPETPEPEKHILP